MKYFATFAVVCISSAAVAGLMLPDQMWLFGETGPFETIGLLALVAAAFVLLWHVPVMPVIAPVVVLLLLAERELEVEAWQGESTLRTALIWFEDTILHNQIAVIGIALFLLVMFSVFTVPFMRGRPIRASLQVQVLVFGVVCAVLGQLGEAIVNDLVTDPSEALKRAMLGVEEVSEAFFSVSVLCATVVAVVRSRRLRKNANNDGGSPIADAGTARRHPVFHDDAGDASGDDLPRG